eukprot:CAMPEP_0197577502 /NCGR_PEP_ID=MMETSP1326-20131121/2112_1 /TAXON_ID=1155430 /ORGANISM="Genus nov. species nov., Strain RCC2288" /LENGTH=111 /DNA_ID=CAMNT_0043140583 /DNA_START=236 /DNA_END=571 /DNA_ORIENTATION=+
MRVTSAHTACTTVASTSLPSSASFTNAEMVFTTCSSFICRATRTTASSSAAHASGPGALSSFPNPFKVLLTSCGVISCATRATANSSVARVSGPGSLSSFGFLSDKRLPQI